MHRSIAILLGFALVAASGRVSGLHIHAYAEHDHPDHRHGLADHQHQFESGRHDGTVRLEPCDPGRHAIPVVLGCAALAHIDAADAERASRGAVEPPLLQGVHLGLNDFRIHSPPGRPQALPRGPPLTAPA